MQDGEPKGDGILHTLHECPLEYVNGHRIDYLNHAVNTLTHGNVVASEVTSEEEYCEVIYYIEEDQALRRLIKGKGHDACDIQIQIPKSKNKPSQKRRRKVMRNKNAGISID